MITRTKGNIFGNNKVSFPKGNIFGNNKVSFPKGNIFDNNKVSFPKGKIFGNNRCFYEGENLSFVIIPGISKVTLNSVQFSSHDFCGT